MKNNEIGLKLKNLSIIEDLSGPDCSMPIVRNIRLLKSKQEELEAIIKPTEEYKKLDAERHAIFSGYADKKEDGTPEVKNINPETGSGILTISDKELAKKCEKETKDFVEKNKKVFDAHNKKIETYYKILEQDSEIKFEKIEEKKFPKNTSVKQFLFLEFMLK